MSERMQLRCFAAVGLMAAIGVVLLIVSAVLTGDTTTTLSSVGFLFLLGPIAVAIAAAYIGFFLYGVWWCLKTVFATPIIPGPRTVPEPLRTRESENDAIAEAMIKTRVEAYTSGKIDLAEYERQVAAVLVVKAEKDSLLS